MKQKLSLQTFTSLQTALIVFAITATILAALSGFVYPEFYSPLLFLGAIVIVVMFIAFLLKPVWALYVSLFVVFLPLGLLPFNIQSILNRSLTMVAIGAWLVGLIIRRKQIRLTVPSVLMVCFLVWSAVTLLWAKELMSGITVLQSYTLRFMFFLFLIPNEIRTKEDLTGLMKTLSFSGWLFMLVAVISFVSQGYTPGSRFKVLEVNENEAGTIAMLTMIGVLWQASQPSPQYKILKKFVAFIFFLLTLGLVAISGSRGSAISLFITLIAFWAWKPSRPWAKLSVFILVLAAIFAPTVFTTLVQRFTVLEPYDTPLGGREVLWQASWRLIQDHPLLGVGIGNAPYAIMPYLKTDARLVGLESESIHNPIFTVWCETAMLGILLYVGVLISAFWSFGKQYFKYKESNSLAIIPFFAFVGSVALGYLVSWFKGGGMETGYSYFLILALLMLPSALDPQAFEEHVMLSPHHVITRPQ